MVEAVAKEIKVTPGLHGVVEALKCSDQEIVGKGHPLSLFFKEEGRTGHGSCQQSIGGAGFSTKLLQDQEGEAVEAGEASHKQPEPKGFLPKAGGNQLASFLPIDSGKKVGVVVGLEDRRRENRVPTVS